MPYLADNTWGLRAPTWNRFCPWSVVCGLSLVFQKKDMNTWEIWCSSAGILFNMRFAGCLCRSKRIEIRRKAHEECCDEPLRRYLEATVDILLIINCMLWYESHQSTCVRVFSSALDEAAKEWKQYGRVFQRSSNVTQLLSIHQGPCTQPRCRKDLN